MNDSSKTETREMRESVHKALRHWTTKTADSDPLLSQLVAVQRAQATLGAGDNPAMLRAAINKVLQEAMDDLEKRTPRVVEVLQKRFVTGKTLQEVANMMNFSTHQISRMQRDGIEQLTDILQAQEREIGRERARSLESVLPPPTYTRLFGVDELCQELVAMLAAPEAPWVVALVGMGGLGKTAVADWVTRHLIQELSFSHLVWIRAGASHTMGGQAEPPSLTYEKVLNQLLAELFPEMRAPLALVDRAAKVRQALKARPYLVVIDNLEAAEDTSILLNHLNELAQPSKFLLTTRTRVAKQAAVRDVPLDELSFTDSAAFMRHHAAETGVTAVAQATDEDLQKVYAKVGGNPLALKIVVNVLDILPLNRLLDGLTQNYPTQVLEMYKRIYWQAWQTLSENGRALLRAMPLTREPADVDYLLAISGLSENAIWPAIEELRQRSLLEVEGDLHEKRYGIHHLTDTFLRTEIIHIPMT
ncbi:MAG: hypothetical protein H6657_17790 [Ardenticatenaceae bacterium]|nr:hypothetical protein [Ardenticatenaceae bacterium]